MIDSASPAPTILYEGEGLNIRENSKNHFTVCTLYFWADPAKRSPEWRREAEAGMHPAKFRREYLIDYEALFGEKVFPEITEHRDKIVVQPPYPSFPDNALFWGGFDLGQRNASSFHIYTILDGITYSIWELFEPCKNIIEFSRKMLDCPYWPRLRYIAADPHIWDNRAHSMKDGSLMSMYDQFVEQGISKLIKGNNDEATWLATMRRHWTTNPNDPTFRIFSCCPNQIREFAGAVFPTMSEKLRLSQSLKESIADVDNHSLDDCKYFMNSRPNYQQKKVKYPTMVRRWLK